MRRLIRATGTMVGMERAARAGRTKGDTENG